MLMVEGMRKLQGVCFLAFVVYFGNVFCFYIFETMPCYVVDVTIYLRGAKVKSDLSVLVNEGVC